MHNNKQILFAFTITTQQIKLDFSRVTRVFLKSRLHSTVASSGVRNWNNYLNSLAKSTTTITIDKIAIFNKTL